MIWIRADANKEIGTGHVMRCLTVANALKKLGKEVCFLLADENAVPLLKEKGYSYIVLHSDYQNPEGELGQLEELLKLQRPSFLLVDSYFVTSAYFEKLSQHTGVGCFDDMGNKNYPVDLLINYNIYATDKLYQGGCQKKSLLGARYIPLREEFGQTHYQVRPEVKRVLVTTGGSDRYNLAGRILEGVMADKAASELTYDVVCGAYNSHLPALRKLEEEYKNINIHCGVKNMAELMENCDIAVTAGGSTIYELSAVGVPFLCFSFAENQEQLVQTYGKNGWTGYAGNYLTEGGEMISRITENIVTLVSQYGLREKYSRQLKSIVDGQGALRIAEELIAAGR